MFIIRTFRSTNVKEPGELSAPSSNLNTAFRLIKEIQKKYKTREAEEKEKADLVEQDNLVINQSKGYPKLKVCTIQPLDPWSLHCSVAEPYTVIDVR